MDIREAAAGDLTALLELYTYLHDNPIPETDTHLLGLWEGILADRNHHIAVGFENGRLVSSCVVVIIPNLTRGQRPYALVENVITHPDFRGRGFASQLLAYAGRLAEAERCYKIMLMTGSKEPATLSFYERAGFNRGDKTAFIRWLP